MAKLRLGNCLAVLLVDVAFRRHNAPSGWKMTTFKRHFAWVCFVVPFATCALYLMLYANLEAHHSC